MTVHGSFVSLNKSAAAVWHLWRGESTVQWKVRAGFCSEVRNEWEEGQRWRLLWSYLRKWESVCVCLSDGSLHLPLSSRRTNYKVMDSRLITRATSGFKLAEPWSRAWSDGEGQERRGTWVQRENEVTARRKGKHLHRRAEFNKMHWQKRKRGLSHSPLVLCTSHTGSSFSLGCFWILFRLCRLHLCPPSPLRFPFILFHLHVFSLPFSLCFFLLFLPGFDALSAKWKRVSVQALCFFSDTMLQANQRGSWACVNHSHSPHLWFHIQVTETHSHGRIKTHAHAFTLSHLTAALHLLLFRNSNQAQFFFLFTFFPILPNF